METLVSDRLLIDLLIQLGEESKMYGGTTVRQWKRHLEACYNEGQVELIRDNGMIIGFLTWFKTPNPYKETFDNYGKYVVIPLMYIKPGYRNLHCYTESIKKMIRANYRMGKFEGVEYIVWKRPEFNKTCDYWRTLELLPGGGVKWAKRVALK